MKTGRKRGMKWLILSLMLLVFSTCALAQRAMPHSFEFDAGRDSPEEVILDFQYGNFGIPVTRVDDESRKSGKTRQAGGVYATMPKGEFLYVKWRIKQTGQVYEDRVDLRDRLPDDITNYRIRFIVKGPQLHVYLITTEKLNPNPCPPHGMGFPKIGQPGPPDMRIFNKYCNLKIIKLYPDQTKP